MSFIEFEVSNPERFEALSKVFNALRIAKQTDNFLDDDYWLQFFDEQARAYFWWPTVTELQAWYQRWQAAPVSKRHTDPTLKVPWSFGSMIDAFRSGEYNLVTCTMRDDKIGRLQFQPVGDPYGGTGCLKALIEAFGFKITKESEG